MKIAHVISTPPFAWATGGCAKVAYDLSRSQAKIGYDVTIITTDLYQPMKRYPYYNEVIKGVNIVRFRYISDTLAWKYKLYISPMLWFYVKNNISNYDIVHLQDFISLQAIFTVRYCRKYNIPYVLTAHGSISWLYNKSVLSKLFYKLFGSKILNNASKIFALTESEATLCKALGIDENKVTVITNGISDFDYNLKLERGGFKKKYHIGPQEKIILYLGRLNKSKGIDLLIEAFDSVHKKIPNTKLVIAGPDDGYFRELEKISNLLKLNDQIIFTGFISLEEKMSAYTDADIFVTPSYSGFPMTFLEACLFGLPIVTSSNGDRLNWIDNKCGYIVNYTVDDLQDAIIRIIDNNDIKEKFSAEGKRIASDIFNWDIISNNLCKEYIHILQNRGV